MLSEETTNQLIRMSNQIADSKQAIEALVIKFDAVQTELTELKATLKKNIVLPDGWPK